MCYDIKAVIFDQDGLMFDTERISARAWNYVSGDFGVVIEEEFLASIRGSSAAEAKISFISHYGPGIDYDSLRAKKQERYCYDVRTNGLPVKPGLVELLQYLKKHKCKIALATASTKDWSLDNLRIAGVTEYFDEIVCGDMVSKCKPDPEIFLAAAKLLAEEPEHCLVLEDSFNGIKAAYAGGFPSIMVPDMAQPGEELLKIMTAKCDSLSDVIALFEEGSRIELEE